MCWPCCRNNEYPVYDLDEQSCLSRFKNNFEESNVDCRIVKLGVFGLVVLLALSLAVPGGLGIAGHFFKALAAVTKFLTLPGCITMTSLGLFVLLLPFILGGGYSLFRYVVVGHRQNSYNSGSVAAPAFSYPVFPGQGQNNVPPNDFTPSAPPNPQDGWL